MNRVVEKRRKICLVINRWTSLYSQYRRHIQRWHNKAVFSNSHSLKYSAVLQHHGEINIRVLTRDTFPLLLFVRAGSEPESYGTSHGASYQMIKLKWRLPSLNFNCSKQQVEVAKESIHLLLAVPESLHWIRRKRVLFSMLNTLQACIKWFNLSNFHPLLLPPLVSNGILHIGLCSPPLTVKSHPQSLISRYHISVPLSGFKNMKGSLEIIQN